MRIDINRIWYKKQKSIIAICLVPFSIVYRCIIFVRRSLYRMGLLKITRLPVPVIIVGNLTVGGTGKTPLLIALIHLFQQAGFHPGVISRGYGGKSQRWPQSVTENSDPFLVGDEAVLIAKNTRVPVCVGPDRVAAAKYLLLHHDQCDVILSDDGLQHLALARDGEIVVIDGLRRFGNQRCLPAGPLREPLSRLKKVDFVVANGKANENEFSMQFVPQGFYRVAEPLELISLEQMPCKKIIAVAGIGNPDRFFKTLDELKLNFETRVFPDHHQFTASDIACREDEVIIMTEKDAVKCREFATDQYFYLKGGVVLEDRFKRAIVDFLRSAVR